MHRASGDPFGKRRCRYRVKVFCRMVRIPIYRPGAAGSVGIGFCFFLMRIVSPRGKAVKTMPAERRIPPAVYDFMTLPWPKEERPREGERGKHRQKNDFSDFSNH